ncbi:hypothetical protein N1851_030913 [Merluccius polli]|uniref:Gypsy retrotransposon integrase-like protein 1 n=1 Tax=Merluccius polli TaxID=89951 RepID=A0AA47M4R1_MERPO|nr:hypothetical protein N1851_030913 [Merluccius polli]
MAKLGPPESFDFTRPAEWPMWRRRFGRFRVATKLDRDSGEVQVNTLLYAMGREAEAIYDSFVYDGAEEDDDVDDDGEAGRSRPELDYDTVIAKFSDHFVPKRNAQYCEFGRTKDEQIRDRIVIGISDNDVSQKLQLEPELSLERAIQIARQSEQIKQQNVSLRSECAVDAMRQGRRQFHGRRSSNEGQWQEKQEHRPITSPGSEVKSIGKFLATSEYKGKKYRFWVTVIKGPYSHNLLGRSVATKMGLVMRVDGMDTVMLSDVFGDIGLLKCDPVKIELKTDCEPYSLTTPRRIPFPLLPKVEAELRRMLALGIIEEVTEPSDWCAPMVPVEKKNKEQVRVCVDLKRLNKAVKRERYILPTLEDIAPKLVGAKVFSTLDASCGFWQIPLDAASQKLTTFLTPMGRFCFRRLPFGITCQRLLMRLLRFNAVAEHVPGKHLVVADALSRSPLRDSGDDHTDQEVQAYVESVVENAPVSSQKLDKIRSATLQDEELQKIVQFIRNRWPPKTSLLPSLHGYYSARAHLSETDGLVLYQDRLVIPAALRSEVLKQLHEGHQGLTRCRVRARMSVWWPRISAEITKTLSTSLLMAGRHIRTTLPMLEDKLHATRVNRQQIQQKDAQAKSAYQFFYDRRHSTLPLPDLQSGQAVRVKLDGEKGWRMSAKVIGKCTEPRSYMVRTDNGAVLRHLQAVPESANPPDQQQQQPEGPPLQLPSSPPSVARPSHRNCFCPETERSTCDAFTTPVIPTQGCSDDIQRS